MRKYVCLAMAVMAVFGIVFINSCSDGTTPVNSLEADGTVVLEKGGPSHAIQLYSIADACIYELQPDNNSGSAYRMSIRNPYGIVPGFARCALVRFDLSSLLDAKAVTSAKLYVLYSEWDEVDIAGHDAHCNRITSDWDESTVTWNARPSWSEDATGNSVVPEPIGSWMEWDVTADVRDAISGSVEHYGWCVHDATYWGTYDIPIARFYTRESGSCPYLVVETK